MWLTLIVIVAWVFPGGLASVSEGSVIRWIGCGVALVFVLTPKGRAQLASDYQRFVRLRYAK